MAYMDWIPTFGGNMLGWVPTWLLIAVVVMLASVIVLLALAVRSQIEDEDRRDEHQKPLL
jgi:hypothetical protein